MSAQPAETQVDAEPCLKCGAACSLQDGAVAKGGGLHCNLCNCVYQILYRHLGGLPADVQKMSQEKQKAFFQEAGSVIKVAPKNARWSHVRSKLSTSLEEFHIEQTKTTVAREFLPLSVWEKRGFDKDNVEQNGETRKCPVTCLIFLKGLASLAPFFLLLNMFASEVFGDVYSAPLTTVKGQDIRGSVEKQLAEKEWALKKLKASKKRGKGQTAPDANASGAAASSSGAVLVDDDAWSIPSSDEESKKESKVPKKGKEDDGSAARREARQLAMKWKQEVSKAAKSMAVLNSLTLSIATLLEKSSKNPGLLSGTVQDGLKGGGIKLADLKSRALAACLYIAVCSAERCVRYN